MTLITGGFPEASGRLAANGPVASGAAGGAVVVGAGSGASVEGAAWSGESPTSFGEVGADVDVDVDGDGDGDGSLAEAPLGATATIRATTATSTAPRVARSARTRARPRERAAPCLADSPVRHSLTERIFDSNPTITECLLAMHSPRVNCMRSRCSMKSTRIAKVT